MKPRTVTILWIIALLLGVNVVKEKKAHSSSSELAGKVYVFTGVRDPALEASITSKGGVVSDSIKKATHLVIKDIHSASSKAVYARANSIVLVKYESASTNLNPGK